MVGRQVPHQLRGVPVQEHTAHGGLQLDLPHATLSFPHLCWYGTVLYVCTVYTPKGAENWYRTVTILVDTKFQNKSNLNRETGDYSTGTGNVGIGTVPW